jgi:3'-phosphoadenosine 5'-phosphosulfate (PAPS) 3'-phosphatase
VELAKDLLASLTIDDDDEVPLDELTLFVDPLDGTREFVEGRLQNVACLIGIARNRRPLAGVIGLPFPEGTAESDCVVHYAIAGQCSGTWPVVDGAKSSSTSATSATGMTILTGDSNDPVLVNATNIAMAAASNNPQHVIIGGTAAKLREVASTPNSLAILHFKTELWDTCAPEALITTKGGKITDLFGSPLVHAPDRKFGNIFGVVASSGGSEVTKLHDEVCAKMRADPESVHTIFGKWMGDTKATEAQAIDVARDLDGIPLDVKWIEDHLKDETGGKASLVGYSVPESGAWRGLMSNGGRLLLEWDRDDNTLPKSVFYKRIVMSDLAHARDKLTSAPHKVIRDVRSYQVETAFLTSKACQEGLIGKAGLRINKVFGSDIRAVAQDLGPKEQIESRFAVLLEDFNIKEGWEQEWLLDEEGTKATLAMFARMHAYFWEGSDFWKEDDGSLGKELEEAVWPNGGYMQPALQGYDQLDKVAEGFSGRLPSFINDLKMIKELNGVDLEKIGERLQKVAGVAGEEAHPFHDGKGEAWRKYRTLIHGDPKQANLFFRRSEGELEVGLIDFQWCGFGLAATDIAHHISAALQPSCVSYDGKKEIELLDHYYQCLAEGLIEFGVASSEEDVKNRIFPRQVLQKQYEVALLDICRMVYAYAWRRWKSESKPTPESLNRNAYNKSLPSALWLITRCSTLLSSHETNLSARLSK